MTTETVVETVSIDEEPHKSGDFKKQADHVLLSEALPFASPYPPITPTVLVAATDITTTAAAAMKPSGPIYETIELVEEVEAVEQEVAEEQQPSLMIENTAESPSTNPLCETVELASEADTENSDQQQHSHIEMLSSVSTRSETQSSMIETSDNNSTSTDYHEVSTTAGNFLPNETAPYTVSTTTASSSNGSLTNNSVALAESLSSPASIDEKSTASANMPTIEPNAAAEGQDLVRSQLMDRNFMSKTLDKDFLRLSDFCKSIEERLSALPPTPTLEEQREHHQQQHERDRMESFEMLKEDDPEAYSRITKGQALIARAEAGGSIRKAFMKKISTSIFKIFKRARKVKLEERRSILERTYKEVYSDGGPYDDFLSSRHGTSFQSVSPNGSNSFNSTNGFSVSDTASSNNDEQPESPTEDKKAPIYRRFIATAILYNLSKTEPPVPYMRPEAGSKTHQFEEFCDKTFFGMPTVVCEESAHA